MSNTGGGALLPNEATTVTGWTMTNPTFTGTVTNTGASTNSSLPQTTANIGTVATGVTAVEYGNGVVHTTVLSFTALAMAISDTNVGGGTKIYTFPEGNIALLGATATVTETTTSTIASTLKASKTLSVGVGSVATTTQGSGTLVTTQQDIVNAFACTSSATINVAGTAVNGKQLGTTTIRLDGTTTASPVYLNCGVVTGTDIDADATTTWTGTVTISWVWNGDY